MSLFEEIENLTKQGFWSDSLRIDRLMIEAKTCPKCWKPLEYKGFSCVGEYRAYGVCLDCKFAKKFWTETAHFAAFKKKIEKKISAANAVT